MQTCRGEGPPAASTLAAPSKPRMAGPERRLQPLRPGAFLSTFVDPPALLSVLAVETASRTSAGMFVVLRLKCTATRPRRCREHPRRVPLHPSTTRRAGVRQRTSPGSCACYKKGIRFNKCDDPGRIGGGFYHPWDVQAARFRSVGRQKRAGLGYSGGG